MLWHGTARGRPVIALHGWLDNLASFSRLAPLVDISPFLALDLAGHGFSDHRSADASYHIWDDLKEIINVADQMGWQQFSLIGHSRGGIIASLLAACFPERVSSLVLVEGFWPITATAENFVSQLSRSIKETNRVQRQESRYFPTADHFFRLRGKGLPDLDHCWIEALVERSLVCEDKGYRWSFDRRLQAPSPVMLGDAMVEEMIKSLECPVQLYCGRSSMGAEMTDLQQKLHPFKKLEIFVLSGGHHLHLENAAISIAEEVSRFLARY